MSENTTSPYLSQPSPAAASPPISEFRGEHRFLSNFWYVPGGVSLAGMTGPTVEHVYQAMKVLDLAEQALILAAEKPVTAKQLGAQATLRPNWEAMKLGVMARLQAAKYARPEMARLLLATADAELTEGNHWCDTFWGVCTCRTHDRVGTNWLGRILMIQRSVLRG